MKTKAYLLILPLAAALALSCTREIIDPATETAAVAAEKDHFCPAVFFYYAFHSNGIPMAVRKNKNFHKVSRIPVTRAGDPE